MENSDVNVIHSFQVIIVSVLHLHLAAVLFDKFCVKSVFQFKSYL